MQTHFMPKSICNQIDSLTRGFIWGRDGSHRSWNLVNWETLTSPKKYGGLDIRDTRITNVALLGKLIWNIIHDKHKLWVQVLTHKYLGNNSIWCVNDHKEASITWRSIMKTVTALRGGFEMRFNDGNSSFWYSD